MRAVALLLLVLSACGPGPEVPIDAAAPVDGPPREAAPPDAAPLDADLRDRPMRDSDTITCSDPLESNDARESATDLLHGDISVDRVGICTDLDTDWYTTTPIANGSISFTIRFTHYDGDLVLDLMNGSGGLLQRSDTSSFARGEEVILLPNTPANAKIFVRVSAKRADDRVPYLLFVDYL